LTWPFRNTHQIADEIKVDSKWRRLISVTLASGVVLTMTLPALGSHTPAHALEQINAITAQAIEDMDEVVADFATAISGMTAADEVKATEQAALDEIDSIRTAARDAIDDLLVLYQGPLGKPAGDAKKAISDKRLEARNAIGDLADAWVPAVITTTTTTTPTTTTTTMVSTTTTTTGSGNSGNGGNSGSGSGGGNSNGSGPPATPRAEGEGGTSGSTETPPSGSSSGSESTATSAKDPISPVPDEITGESGEILVLATETPQETAFFTPQSVELMEDASRSTATQRMAAALDTVLPPEMVDLVLSPLLILEILARTILDGGARVIGPISLLALSGLLMFAYDRRSRRAAPAGGH
jgi:hypothetical protein